jgi:hypothetical protein
VKKQGSKSKNNPLGRNPFGKNKVVHEPENTKEVKVEKVETPIPTTKAKGTLGSKLADWLLVDIPAGTFIFGLKTVLYTRDLMQRGLRAKD